MRGLEVTEAVNKLWKELPVGLGKDFNTVLKYIERIESHREIPFEY